MALSNTLAEYMKRKERLDKEVPLDFDASGIAEKARARGRYELAGQLFSQYATWYKAHVVGNPYPDETREDRERFAEYLKEFESMPLQMAQAAIDRDSVLKFLKTVPSPASRKEIENACPVTHKVKYDVFLNQLVRGEWLTETGEGKNKRYALSSAKRVSDAQFLKSEKSKS